MQDTVGLISSELHRIGEGVPRGAKAPQEMRPEVSVVVPIHNEAGNVLPLVAEIVAALTGVASFEIVYVDDGSTDETPSCLTAASERTGTLRVLRHARRAGQSAALRTGVLAARGRWIATLDGDGQNDPADIPELLARARELAKQRGNDGVLIAGWRRKRSDGWYTRWQSKVANSIRARLLGDGTPDTGCGLKVYARAVFVLLPYFDHMHRFMPALIRRAGGEVHSHRVNHRARTSGRSHYGLFNRLWTGIVDMAGVLWLARRAQIVDAIELNLEQPRMAAPLEPRPAPSFRHATARPTLTSDRSASGNGYS